MFYADLIITQDSEYTHTINLAIEAASFSIAVAMAEAWCMGVKSTSRFEAKILNITSGAKPRGKTYFKFSDADAIRRGLAI